MKIEDQKPWYQYSLFTIHYSLFIIHYSLFNYKVLRNSFLTVLVNSEAKHSISEVTAFMRLISALYAIAAGIAVINPPMVVTKAAEELRTKTTRKSITRSSYEVEDKHFHEFNNKDGTDHVNGVYCYVDRISCAQPYNYGKRLMLRAQIASPGKDIRCMAEKADAHRLLNLDAPPDFDVRVEALTSDTYKVKCIDQQEARSEEQYSVGQFGCF